MRLSLTSVIFLTILLVGCSSQDVSQPPHGDLSLCPLCSPRQLEIPFEKTAKLTEQAAIQITKKSLIKIRHTSPDMTPATLYPDVPEGEEGGRFHKSNPSSDAGTILWHIYRQGGSLWRIRVDIVREGDHVICTVHRPTQSHSCMDGSWWDGRP
jgi:hypothetical protein